MTTAMELVEAPGYLVRRAYQLHTLLWGEEVGNELTSVQFAVLNEILSQDGLDQVTLGARTGLDRSTAADICVRLERRGFLARGSDPTDGRRRVLQITAEGRAIHARALPGVERVGSRLLHPLSASEADQLLSLLRRLAGT